MYILTKAEQHTEKLIIGACVYTIALITRVKTVLFINLKKEEIVLIKYM